MRDTFEQLTAAHSRWWLGDQLNLLNLPDPLPPIEGKVRQVTPYQTCWLNPALSVQSILIINSVISKKKIAVYVIQVTIFIILAGRIFGWVIR